MKHGHEREDLTLTLCAVSPGLIYFWIMHKTYKLVEQTDKYRTLQGIWISKSENSFKRWLKDVKEGERGRELEIKRMS